MPDLGQLDFLKAIECSWRPRFKPPLAVSRPQVEADLAWEVESPLGGTLTGKGVIICDFDTGANYLHATTFQLSDDVFDWLDTDLSGDLTAGDGVDLNGNGTSSDGPHVAGVVAMLKELLPTLDSGLCRQYLRSGAGTDEWTGDSDRWTSGKLRIYRAISHMITDVTETVPFPELRLSASPNPFNPRTTIRFDLPTGEAARLRIFSVDGREVWSRELPASSPGPREVVWNGKNTRGQGQASGLCFAHVIQGKRYAATKLTLLK